MKNINNILVVELVNELLYNFMLTWADFTSVGVIQEAVLIHMPWKYQNESQFI